MATIREEVVTRVVNLLNTSRPAGIPAARLRRPMPMNQGGVVVDPELNVYFTREDGRPATNKPGPLTFKETTIIVENRRIATLETIETILEPAHQWVEDSLAGSNLDGYVHIISFNGMSWVPHFEDKVYAVSLMRFTIEYQTRRDNAGLFG